MSGRGQVNTSQTEARRGAGWGEAAGGGGLGIAGVVIALIFALTGGGSGGAADILRQIDAPSSTTADPQPLECPNGAETNNACFVTAVVNDVQATWQDLFRQGAVQGTYKVTKLVLFTDATQSGCGQASSATGPFYCPADSKVYLDLGFFQEL